VLVVLVGGLVAPRSTAAQRQAALVHGFAADGSTWTYGSFWFSSEFQSAQLITPSLSGLSDYPVQGQNLLTSHIQQGWSPLQTALVAHSNGGVVSRYASRDWISPKGIITVGTPHTGAPIAQVAAQAIGHVFSVAVAMWAPIAAYEPLGLDPPVFDLPMNAWWLDYALLAVRLSMASWDANVTPSAAPLLTNLRPGSAFLQSLNSAANLSREAAAMPQRRFGIQTTVSPNGVTCGPGGPRPEDCSAVMNLLISAYWGAYVYYSNYSDLNDPHMYTKRQNAYLWLNGATAMSNSDSSMCYYLTGIFFDCTTDGLIPHSHSAFPNAPNITYYHILHRDQPQHTTVLSRMALHLRESFSW
jgi:hypothetical protein